ncbi:MAG: TetR/AcrR family transcriptional regulator [Pseudomonadota bacterium]
MTRKRSRLSVEDRHEQLLDAAKQCIVNNGLNSLTMKSIAGQANVSKPLLYKYFDTRLDLLQALLAREDERRYSKLRRSLASAKGYEQIVRAVVNHNFDERSKGDVWAVLVDQPDVAAIFQTSRTKRRMNLGRFLIKATMEHYAISRVDARRVLRMASSASIGAAEYYALNHKDREEHVATTIDFIFNGLNLFPKA